jgi:hypothetical protein
LTAPRGDVFILVINGKNNQIDRQAKKENKAFEEKMESDREERYQEGRGRGEEEKKEEEKKKKRRRR